MKRVYEGHLTEESFVVNIKAGAEIQVIVFNFTYGGKSRIESLFEEFVDGKTYRITIEEVKDRKELKPLYSTVSAPITAERELVTAC